MNKTVRSLLWIGAGAAAVAAANSAVFARAKALGNTLGGEGRFWKGPHGDLFYTRQGKGRPVVLLHGFYAGASSYEWRKNFDSLSEHFCVTAFDWLGFGLSDKPDIKYTPHLYMEYFARFLREVIQEPCTVIASSLAGAYAIQTAADCPELIESLILVCPTGMHHLSDAPGARSELAYQALRSPVAGTAAYNLLTSEASLRSYLMNNTYFDPSYVDDAMIEHYSTASHQYGSQFAPPAFISGLLNYSVRSVFPRLTQKTIRLVWGREAKQTPLEDLEAFLAANGRAEPTIFDKSGLLPHDEQAQGFNRLVVEIINADKPKRTRTKTSAVAEPPSDAEGG